MDTNIRNTFKLRANQFEKYDIPVRFVGVNKGVTHLLNSTHPMCVTFGSQTTQGKAIAIYVHPAIKEYGMHVNLLNVGFAQQKSLISLALQFDQERFKGSNTLSNSGMTTEARRVTYLRRTWPFKWPEEGSVYLMEDWEPREQSGLGQFIVEFFGRKI